MSALAIPLPQSWLDWTWASHQGQSTGPSPSWSTRLLTAARLSRSPESERLGQSETASPIGGAEQVQKFLLLDQIERMAALPSGWDGYSAQAPSTLARKHAAQALESLYRLGSLPLRAVSLVDGGVALLLSVKSRYSAIEVYDDGEVVAAFSDRLGCQEAWNTSIDTAGLRATLDRFRELANG